MQKEREEEPLDLVDSTTYYRKGQPFLGKLACQIKVPSAFTQNVWTQVNQIIDCIRIRQAMRVKNLLENLYVIFYIYVCI